MDSFEKRIADCVNEKLNDGTVERLIEEKLEKGISDAISEIFSYGGKAKKALVSKVEEIMVPIIEQHDFNQYLVKLDSVLTELVNNTSLADNKVILENFQQLMKNPVKDFEVVPVSRIYDEYQDYVSKYIDTSNLEVDTDDKPSYFSATTNMEIERCEKHWFSSSSEDYIIKFSCDEDENMNCEFKVSGGYSDSKLRIEATTIPIDINSLRTLSSFEIFIQHLIRSFAKINLDIMESFGDDVEVEAEPEASFS